MRQGRSVSSMNQLNLQKSFVRYDNEEKERGGFLFKESKTSARVSVKISGEMSSTLRSSSMIRSYEQVDHRLHDD